MATKSDETKAEQQRAAHARKPKPSKAAHASAGKQAEARGRRPGQAQASGKASSMSAPNPASHNQSARAERKSSYQFEVSATARPSRKSSRRSATTRVKPDAPLRITAMNRLASPKQRASRPSGNPN